MAQLELLKIDLQVSLILVLMILKLKFSHQEKKINKNAYAEESENIWKAMKDVEKCEELCKPFNT